MILAVLIIIKRNLTFCPAARLCEGLHAVDKEQTDKGLIVNWNYLWEVDDDITHKGTCTFISNKKSNYTE